ncbi:MAG: hypothetical protein EX254_09070 [Flavobacteriaceae bacterium]|nr:hypothetical protein [Bacteroidia bacterium]NND11380.1 hypothetical protein [Flavobacteriaceae bacterium]NNK27451.1 hypothetical protein [Flavobacteriaceae bacterium]NNL61297.1 hypothetical protein [Flavobacteriaceae bacterium]RZV60304.1 MAG: hypothetical protein EX254_09070 [Flavobacteriaceae bacterium]
MTDKLITVKEVSLNNNCPECYSTDGLTLTFKQKFKETKFYRSITNEVVEELKCNKCQSTIYPVSWTDAIDRVVDYQKKAFVPKPASLKLKRLAWIIFIVIDLITLLVILMLLFPEVLGMS